jgi:hypothetical protein
MLGDHKQCGMGEKGRGGKVATEIDMTGEPMNPPGAEVEYKT